jgi:4,5-DOPA dioxygenase extradiol
VMTETGSNSTGRMPVLFMGHGSPMNAIEDNHWSRAFRALAAELPRPKAILSISAHWYIRGTYVTDNEQPPTIHDFGGFPQELFQVQYPAPGDPEMAQRIVKLLGRHGAALRADLGLDHGTWSVLRHLRPDADCPVLQLSIDQNLSLTAHLEIGHALAALREVGVLVMGSGNITHNLRDAFQRGWGPNAETPDWAQAFDRDIASAIEQHDTRFLTTSVESDYGRLSHPTLDHYLPLLYSIGAADIQDRVRFPITGFDLGSLSMRAALLG